MFTFAMKRKRIEAVLGNGKKFRFVFSCLGSVCVPFEKNIKVGFIWLIEFFNLNRPFPSCLLRHFQNESSCETIRIKVTLIYMKMAVADEAHFHMNGFA